MTVLVTGATGTVGAHVVRHLLRAGRKVRALTRDPASAHLPEGVEVIAGDLTDATTLAPAFDGVTAAHLINFGRGYRPLRNGQEIVDLALRAGVRAVTVLGGWETGSLEPAVQAGDLRWTLLRPVEFMANTLADWGESLRTTGVVREPYGDRKSPPIHESDIGAVAAAVLTQDGHAGQAYHLTGPEVVTPRDKVRMLAEATGRDLRFEELTPGRTRQEWVTEGGRPERLLFRAFPPGLGDAELVEMLLRLYGTPNELGTTVTDAVEKVTGRPARTFAEWAAEHAGAFRPGSAERPEADRKVS
ncbi:SDR family oxidoreductase [Planotetraspora phitsanulokensis]|uniref:Nucleotide-diphosphate-sugar epimerase n=1 Tax=Planotetraspora phitsanulokensis TaxID=575192 RepID=A0A8J3UBJ3_9ACTN|nr:NmrA family NAD(P)-binding protein [Planotetraspora phitsanulokensis]GII42403.1 nucleotide-diphosphate-sugar epimerase [Planotetraspora phitsanulokensis]